MFDLTPLLPGFQEIMTYPTLTTTATLFVRPNPRRAILYVSNGSGAVLSMWIDPSVPANAPAAVPVAAGALQRFTWPLDGPMSTYGWLGSLATGSGTVAVLEILWLPEQLGHATPGG